MNLLKTKTIFFALMFSLLAVVSCTGQAVQQPVAVQLLPENSMAWAGLLRLLKGKSPADCKVLLSYKRESWVRQLLLLSRQPTLTPEQAKEAKALQNLIAMIDAHEVSLRGFINRKAVQIAFGVAGGVSLIGIIGLLVWSIFRRLHGKTLGGGGTAEDLMTASRTEDLAEPVTPITTRSTWDRPVAERIGLPAEALGARGLDIDFGGDGALAIDPGSDAETNVPESASSLASEGAGGSAVALGAGEWQGDEPVREDELVTFVLPSGEVTLKPLSAVMEEGFVLERRPDGKVVYHPFSEEASSELFSE